MKHRTGAHVRVANQWYGRRETKIKLYGHHKTKQKQQLLCWEGCHMLEREVCDKM